MALGNISQCRTISDDFTQFDSQFWTVSVDFGFSFGENKTVFDNCVQFWTILTMSDRFSMFISDSYGQYWIVLDSTEFWTEMDSTYGTV